MVYDMNIGIAMGLCVCRLASRQLFQLRGVSCMEVSSVWVLWRDEMLHLMCYSFAEGWLSRNVNIFLSALSAIAVS